MKNFLIFSLFVLCVLPALAQDPMFTQFYQNRLNLNPAFAGADNGSRGAVMYREQWPTIPTRFTTYAGSFDFGLPRLGGGAGMYMQRNVEGAGMLATTSGALMLSKVFGLMDSPDQKLYIYTGLSAAMVNKSIDWDKLRFSDQYDAVLGEVNATSATPAANPVRNYADFGTGMMIRYKKNRNFHSLGFAAAHLTRPDEAFLGREMRLPVKYTFHYLGHLPLLSTNLMEGWPIYLSPGVMVQRQGDFQSTMLGGYLSYGSIFAGLWYRSVIFNFNERKLDGAAINFGYKGQMGNDTYYTFGYSYDATLSRLSSNTAGSHEISLVIEYNPVKKRQVKKLKNCRDFKQPAEVSLPVF